MIENNSQRSLSPDYPNRSAPEPVAEALALFKSRGVDRILCPGDIAGYGADLDQTVALLLEHDCQAVLGNQKDSLGLIFNKSQNKFDSRRFIAALTLRAPVGVQSPVEIVRPRPGYGN